MRRQRQYDSQRTREQGHDVERTLFKRRCKELVCSYKIDEGGLRVTAPPGKLFTVTRMKYIEVLFRPERRLAREWYDDALLMMEPGLVDDEETVS